MDFGKGEHMNLKLVGTVCVIFSCAGCGFLIAAQHLTKIRLLRNLISVLDYMQCELQYRRTQLPQLCRQAAQQVEGKVRQLFDTLADELDAQISPDAYRCMSAALHKVNATGSVWGEILAELGKSLGKFDISGQIQGLEHARMICREQLEYLMHDKDNRMRSYQTLGLCAGAAIAILLV